jgi:antitoxin HicB
MVGPMDTEHYPAQVFWSVEDQAFIAVAVDLPGSSALGSTQAEALSELQIVIEGWIEAQNAVGNPIPNPSRPAAPSECNGKLLLRLPRWLHASLVKGAKIEGVSLNSHIMAMLAAAVGAKSSATGPVAVSGSAPQQTRSRTA